MLRKQEEILADLDATLDQLIQNVSILSECDLCVLDNLEIDSLHKTQESLVARFVHTNEHLNEKERKSLANKVERFTLLNETLARSFAQEFSTATPRIGRNRKSSKQSKFANRTL